MARLHDSCNCVGEIDLGNYVPKIGLLLEANLHNSNRVQLCQDMKKTEVGTRAADVSREPNSAHVVGFPMMPNRKKASLC